MTDGDAHPTAIVELLAVTGRGGDYAEAVGALIRERHNTIRAGKLGRSFEAHEPPLFSMNQCVGWSGVTAVFSFEDDTLRLLSVVGFDDFMQEAIDGTALNEALRLAKERI